MNWKRRFPDNCFSMLKINNSRDWHTHTVGFSWLTVNDATVAEMTELLQTTELLSGFPWLSPTRDCLIDNVVCFFSGSDMFENMFLTCTFLFSDITISCVLSSPSSRSLKTRWLSWHHTWGLVSKNSKWGCKHCLFFFWLQLCLTFTWKDAFDKGSLFGGSVKLGKCRTLSLQDGNIKVNKTQLLSNN